MRISTIKLITALSALAVLAIIALATGCSTTSSSTPGTASAGASSSGGDNPAVTGQEPKVPGSDVYNGSEILKATCTVDNSNGSYSVSIGNPNGYPVNLDWVTVVFTARDGKQAGGQTSTLNVPINLAPGQISHSGFGGGLVPDEAYANMPGAGTPPLAGCTAQQWGNAAGN